MYRLLSRSAIALSKSVRITRAFATASIPQQKPAATPKPVSLKTIKKDLIDLLEEEQKSYPGPQPTDDYMKYIKEKEFKITQSDDKQICIVKESNGYSMKIKFSEDRDPADEDEVDEKELEEEEETKNPKAQEENEEENEEDDDADAEFTFKVDLVNKDKSEAGTMRVSCVATPETMYITNLCVGTEAELEKMVPIDFDAFSDPLQDKIADFLDKLGIDDEFAQFVYTCAFEHKRQRFVNALDSVRKFVKS
eukprot:TRINITY_DN259_c0_g1_i1.p1 TRINITY_DN259_c0_g1~~TRINITY_DN259_c0_g1_i1.p1  ORF type:complete len:251 (-),score=66.10 TRINITY_DN259_c0_g1_i1:151-903(-)